MPGKPSFTWHGQCFDNNKLSEYSLSTYRAVCNRRSYIGPEFHVIHWGLRWFMAWVLMLVAARKKFEPLGLRI